MNARKLLLVLSLFVLIGCDGPSDGGGGKGVDGPKEKVRYSALAAKIKGLDPMNISDVYSSGVGSNFYECLYEYHYLKRPYEIGPLLAAAMPTYSEDGLTITIPIRQDVFFHNDECFKPDGEGRQLVVEDFIYSWKRLAYLKNTSKNWWIIEDRIVGMDEFREATKEISKKEMDYSQEVEGLKAIDKFTLQIKLRKPVPDIEYRLAHLPLAAVPREAVEFYGDKLMNHPVGTGAFLLKEWIRGSKLTLVRNTNYREVFYPSEGEAGDKEKGLLDDAGKRLPLLDKAIIRVIEEDQPYWLTFMNKETDYAGIPKDNFGSVINEQRDLTGDMQEKGISLIKWPEPTTFWIGFNMEDPVIGKNLPLRQALNAAFNKKKYIELFTNNRAIAARGPLPPTVAEYNPDLNSPYTQYDPELAKKKIKEAEAVHGGPLPKLTMLIPGTDTTSVQMGQFYVRNFKAVGLDVEFDAMDFPAMQEKVNTKSAQMWAMGWIMDWPDSENMLSLWYGPNEAPGNNGMNYKNPEFDALHKKIAVMRDGEERRQLLRKMEQIVVDDLPCIFASHRQNFLLKYNWFKNHKPHVYGYGLLKFHNVDAKLRFEKTGR